MRYEFIVKGTISRAVEAALPETSSAPYPPGGTALFGLERDDADVMTMFARIGGLGLSVVEIRRLPD